VRPTTIAGYRRAGRLLLPFVSSYRADKLLARRYPAPMPLYRTAVRSSHRYADQDGADLRDDEAARDWALRVIRDLKRNNEKKWNGWTIVVTDGDRKVWQIPFVEAG
jgi:hypothetical protein